MKKKLILLFILFIAYPVCAIYNPNISNETSDNKTSLSLNNDNVKLNYNSKKTSKKSYDLKARIVTKKGSNKVDWKTSDTSVAIVKRGFFSNKKGVVTAQGPGVATVSAVASDGTRTSALVTVQKNIIIVIGASQVVRMQWYVDSYKSDNNIYQTSDETLNFVAKGGEGFSYQTNEGFEKAKKIINEYENEKQYVKFSIFFPLSGNEIKDFSCEEITPNNEKIKGYAANYNNAIQSLKNLGYNVQGYVVSMHPVVPTAKNALKKGVVKNVNKNACKKDYRSNKKYYDFNKSMVKIVENKYSQNLKYEKLFIEIMDTSKENFHRKMPYNTEDDGIHWDKSTTKRYAKLMFSYKNVKL